MIHYRALHSGRQIILIISDMALTGKTEHQRERSELLAAQFLIERICMFLTILILGHTLGVVHWEDVNGHNLHKYVGRETLGCYVGR